MSAFISLAITTYNGQDYLGTAIASVLAQTYPHFELILWDDGSTDDSLAIAQHYAQRDVRLRVVAAPHHGRIPALRAAIELCRGDYVGWIDSDDVLAPTALDETVAVLAGDRSLGWVYTDYVNINSSGAALSYGNRCRIPYSPMRLLVDFVTFHFRLMRREIFERVGGIDPVIQHIEDYDLSLRLSETAPVHHLAKPLYFYRRHSESLSAHHRPEQVYWSQVAINRALQRRGMDRTYRLECRGDRFVLLKHTSVSPNQPAAEPCSVPLPSSLFKPASVVAASLPLMGIAGEAQALVAPPPRQLADVGTQDQTDLTLPISQPLVSSSPEATFAPQFTPNLVAQSIEAANDGTNTIVDRAGNEYTITGGQQSGDLTNLFHSFEQFNLTAEEMATFLSQPEVRNIIGRVGGGDPSVLNGLLQVMGSNANLFLVNPSGILVGPDVQLNLPGSLTLSTANAVSFGEQWFQTVGENDYSLLNGHPAAFAFTTEPPSAIANGGNLTVEPGQSVNLMGGTVTNTGEISAPGGNITITAVPGEGILRLNQPGSLLSFDVETSALPETGSLPVTSLPELLTGSGLDVGLQVSETGEVARSSTQTPIPAEVGDAIATNSLNVANPDGAGGTVTVVGDRVALMGATVRATGTTGGGRVLIGGSYQGQGEVPNAERTLVDGESAIDASALLAGDGGEVIVWADDTTGFFGNIESRGGQLSGNGGFAEVSGKNTLIFRGTADLSAPQGAFGTLLLDPVNITIVDGDGSGQFPRDEELEDSEILVGDGYDSWTISENALEALAGNADVHLEAENNIILEDLTDNALTFAPGTGSITFAADADQEGFGNFVVKDVADTIRAEGRDINITGDNITLGDVDTSSDESDAGNITLGSDEAFDSFDISTGNLTTTSNQGNGGDITAIANIVNLGNVDTSSDESDAGNITLGSDEAFDSADITTGNLTATSNQGNGGDVMIEALSGLGYGTDIVIGAVDASSVLGDGGDVALTVDSQFDSNIAVGEIDTSTEQGQGGDVIFQNQVDLGDQSFITVGNINTASTQTQGGRIEFQHRVDSSGIEFADSIAPDSGQLTISSDTSFDTGDSSILFDGLTIATNDSTLTLSANEIDLVSEAVITGTGNLVLQPGTPETGIAIAGSETTTALDLTATELSQIQGNFNSITIGRSDGSGAIAFAGDYAVDTDLTIQASLGTGTLNTNGFTISANSVELSAAQAITTADIAADDALTLKSGGTIETTAGTLRTAGGAVEVEANGDLAIANITTGGGSDGDIDLTSETGTVRAGNLDASGDDQGGDVTVSAQTAITTGAINTSSSEGNGGNVTLDPEGDIEVASINAQGAEDGGRGGNVDITTERFFRATDTFIDQNQVRASISTAGGAGGGSVTIRHGGGDLATLFTVGPDYNGDNGTVGAITTGTDNTIAHGDYPETYTQGESPSDVRLITDPVPTLPTPPTPPTSGEDNVISEEATQPPTQPVSDNPAQPPVTQANIKPLSQARQALGAVEEATGIRPALVYLQFIPNVGTPSTAGSEDITADPEARFAYQEARYTQSFESYLELPNEATAAPIAELSPDDQLEIMVITAEGMAVWKRVDVTREELMTIARTFRREVADPRKIRTSSYRPSAEQLYDWVITPIQSELQTLDIGNLTFVADEGLRSVPWAALHNGNQFLVEEYSVGLMPSLSLTDTRYVDVRNSQILAAGASEFDNQRPLPAVPIELAILDQLWEGEVIPEDRFTYDTLRQQRQDTPFGIVHLATHGEFRPGAPDNSYIQLKDRQLQLDQIRELGWNDPPLELLVLSACRTALGDSEAELGFAGLAIQAGVKSALASLWYVSDIGTLALMTEFYSQLQNAPDETLKATALQEAQLRLLHGEVTIADGELIFSGAAEPVPLRSELSGLEAPPLTHPYFWAAFTMTGNPW